MMSLNHSESIYSRRSKSRSCHTDILEIFPSTSQLASPSEFLGFLFLVVKFVKLEVEDVQQIAEISLSSESYWEL